MLIDQFIARIQAAVPDLAGSRTEGAAELTELVDKNRLPQKTPHAFVLPLGLRGGAADAVTGIFRQTITEVIGVVLVHRVSGSRTGAKAMVRIDQLVAAIIDTLAGWGPESAPGVVELVRGDLVSMQAGTLIYQLDFSLNDQLRIAR